MQYKHDIIDLISMRRSHRTFQKLVVNANVQHQILLEIQALPEPPFQSKIRLELIPFQEGDEALIHALGTYGMIRNPNGFLAGVTGNTFKDLLDLGYLLEHMVLRLTDMELGSCWLGGSFKKSRFATHLRLPDNFSLPVVVAFGMISERPRIIERIARGTVGSNRRMPWQELFFEYDFEEFLEKKNLGAHEDALEGVRWAPSASNKQPWRVVKEPKKQVYHFYLKRNKQYSRQGKLLKMADLQMIDMGIAMCHFEAVLSAQNINGRWHIEDPDMPHVPSGIEYTVSWIETD